jgi:hypothetical protein
MIVVLLSFNRNATLVDGIDTAKSVAFRFFRLFNVNPELLELELELELELLLVVVGLCNVIVGLELLENG